MLRRVSLFLTEDLWCFEGKRLPPLARFGWGALRVVVLACRSFIKDQCSLRAAALTFFSLLSIVPAAAVAFGIAHGFGFEERLKFLIFKQLSGQEELARRIVVYAESLLINARGGVLAGAGVLLLIWSVLKLLGNIEQAFNEIWQVSRGRTLVRKFADYIAIVFVCPILLLVASGATLLIASSIRGWIDRFHFLSEIEPTLLFPIKVLPFITVWVLFTFVYLIMPNTRVRFRAALGGGIIAGSAYQLLQVFLVYAQIGVSQYSAVYGSFAALLFFLVWLQLSWMIVLFGAEFAYALQYAPLFEFEPVCRHASLRLQALICLRIVQLCVESFVAGQAAPSEAELAQAAGVPPALTTQLLSRLVRAGVLSRVEGPRAWGYQPARIPDQLTAYQVLDLLFRDGRDLLPGMVAPAYDKLNAVLEEFAKSLKSQLLQLEVEGNRS